MSVSDRYAEWIQDQLSGLRGVVLRRMFGGFGLFLDGLMFGLLDDDLCYLKVGEQNRPGFVTAGMSPFTYQARGKTMELSYYQVPDEVLEDGDQLAAWARTAVDVARAAKARAPAKRKPPARAAGDAPAKARPRSSAARRPASAPRP